MASICHWAPAQWARGAPAKRCPVALQRCSLCAVMRLRIHETGQLIEDVSEVWFEATLRIAVAGCADMRLNPSSARQERMRPPLSHSSTCSPEQSDKETIRLMSISTRDLLESSTLLEYPLPHLSSLKVRSTRHVTYPTILATASSFLAVASTWMTGTAGRWPKESRRSLPQAATWPLSL